MDTSQSQDEGPVASLSMVAPESPSYDVTDDDGAALDVEDDANSPDIEYNLLTALPVESIR